MIDNHCVILVGKKSKTRKARGDDRDTQSVTSNLATTLRNRYSGSDYERARQRNRPLPNPADEWDENGDLTDKRRYPGVFWLSYIL